MNCVCIIHIIQAYGSVHEWILSVADDSLDISFKRSVGKRDKESTIPMCKYTSQCGAHKAYLDLTWSGLGRVQVGLWQGLMRGAEVAPRESWEIDRKVQLPLWIEEEAGSLMGMAALFRNSHKGCGWFIWASPSLEIPGITDPFWCSDEMKRCQLVARGHHEVWDKGWESKQEQGPLQVCPYLSRSQPTSTPCCHPCEWVRRRSKRGQKDNVNVEAAICR
jgi:hypothetical protein